MSARLMMEGDVAHAPVITLNAEQRTVLESQPRSRSLPVRVVERARILLLAAARRQNKNIAAMLSMTPKKVARALKRHDGQSKPRGTSPSSSSGAHKLFPLVQLCAIALFLGSNCRIRILSLTWQRRRELQIPTPKSSSSEAGTAHTGTAVRVLVQTEFP